jgi:hypothetical protein
MLIQNHDGTINKPIYYVSRFMIGFENNYSSTNKEAFAMIYAIQKFRHYLLGNTFTFLVDHQTLIYLVYRPIVT